jgi:hypothetical protein
MGAPYLGDYAANETVHFKWNSNDANGASITRSTNGTISVYKDGSDTQTTTGVTDTEDFDGLTGVHYCGIATTDAFYTTATDFSVVLSGATIDTRTVNAVLAHFSIENRPLNAAKISANAIAAAGIASGAITSAKFASGAINSTAINTAAITSVKFGSGAVNSTVLNTAAITSAKFGAGAVNATVLNTGAITATKISTDGYAALNAEMVDALAVDSYEEPGQAAPGSNLSIEAKLSYLYKAWRNLTTDDGSDVKLYSNDGITVDQKFSQSDDGTTYSKGEVESGP